VKNPDQIGTRNCFSGHVSFQSDEGSGLALGRTGPPPPR
jgi:hypothetical protein